MTETRMSESFRSIRFFYDSADEAALHHEAVRRGFDSWVAYLESVTGLRCVVETRRARRHETTTVVERSAEEPRQVARHLIDLVPPGAIFTVKTLVQNLPADRRDPSLSIKLGFVVSSMSKEPGENFEPVGKGQSNQWQYRKKTVTVN